MVFGKTGKLKWLLPYNTQEEELWGSLQDLKNQKNLLWFLQKWGVWLCVQIVGKGSIQCLRNFSKILLLSFLNFLTSLWLKDITFITKGTVASAAISFTAYTFHCKLRGMGCVPGVCNACLRKESSLYPLSLVLLSFDVLFLRLTVKWRHVISSHIIEITTRNEKF